MLAGARTRSQGDVVLEGGGEVGVAGEMMDRDGLSSEEMDTQAPI